jgi:cytochrome c
MRGLCVTLCTVLLVAAVPAARANPELARAKICLGCHDVKDKKIGPAFKDVAARYAGQKDAAARLADKVLRGGSGVWGVLPMPANPRVTPEEARQLVAWILTLK